MNRWLSKLGFGAACAVIALLVNCKSGQPQAPVVTPAPGASTPSARPEGGPRVRVSDEFVRRFGVQISTVSTRRIAPALDLVGSIDFHADHVADIGARIRGRVTRVLVATGVPVHVGTPLVELESMSVGEVIASRASANAQAVAARARLQRETRLFAQQLTTVGALEEARADVARYSAEAHGAEQRLAAMGASDGGRRIVLRAPIEGRVIRRRVIIGQTIDETDVVMRVADLTHLWVYLDVFERDLARVRVGDRAEVRTETYPDRAFPGTVGFIDSTIDMHTRTARVRVEVDNPDLLLRTGQFVTARLRTSSAGERDVTTVPRTAVVQLDGRPAVFLVRGEREFEAATVALGDNDGDQVEVVRGLASGDGVVTEGAFALKSELLR